MYMSLILAQLMFVIGVTPHGGGGVVDPGCRTAAVLVHYLFLVSFMWMLMEGVVLYLVLVKVFVKEHERKYIAQLYHFQLWYVYTYIQLTLCSCSPYIGAPVLYTWPSVFRWALLYLAWRIAMAISWSTAIQPP